MSKPVLRTMEEAEAAIEVLIPEFRGDPSASEELFGDMFVDWALAQVEERYDMAPELKKVFALEFIESQVRAEISADPLATPEQLVTRTGQRLERESRPN